MSWNDAFASHYEEWSAGMTADVAFYVGLALEADGPLVELAIGSGRVAIPVALATGRRVVGIDTSAAMLEQARLGAADAGVDLYLREGDMRDLALDAPAALIYCPFRALLHLPTWADRRRTPSAMRRATTGSTSLSTTGRRARCGGRRRTSGSGSSTSPVSSWWRCTEVLAHEPLVDDSGEHVFVARRG